MEHVRLHHTSTMHIPRHSVVAESACCPSQEVVRQLRISRCAHCTIRAMPSLARDRRTARSCVTQVFFICIYFTTNLVGQMRKLIECRPSSFSGWPWCLSPAPPQEAWTLKHASGASATVYAHGATLTSVTTASGKEILFVSKVSKFDGVSPIRGGIPLVFPIFGDGWGGE